MFSDEIVANSCHRITSTEDFATPSDVKSRFDERRTPASRRRPLFSPSGSGYPHGPDDFFELRVSRLEKFSVVQAVKEFERWARSTDFFDLKNPGGRPNATLLHLAYFRAMKGNPQTKLRTWFGDSLKSSRVVPHIAPMTDYGRSMYAHSTGDSVVSPGAWSDAIKGIASIVIPASQVLVSLQDSK